LSQTFWPLFQPNTEKNPNSIAPQIIVHPPRHGQVDPVQSDPTDRQVQPRGWLLPVHHSI